MILLFLPHRWKQRLRSCEVAARMVNLIGWLFIVALGFVVLFARIEKVSIEESIWQMWQTATTVGYGNKPAQTTMGRVLTMALGGIAIALMGAMITAVFDFRADRQARRRLGMVENPYIGGYVIFNFPGESHARRLIRELRFVERDVPVCIVDNRVDELPPGIASLAKVHFVKGSVLDEETYRQARVDESKTIIVFPLDSDNPDSDGQTHTVVSLLQRCVSPETKIVHVQVDERNSHLFEGLRTEAIHECLEVLAIVQECQDTRSARIVHNVLSNTTGANPKTVVPRQIIGWQWRDLLAAYPQAAERLGVRVSVFALIRGDQVDACPLPDTMIEKGDLLSLLTYDNDLDWAAFEREMRAVQGSSSGQLVTAGNR